MNRRTFLGTAAAAGTALALPRRARASVSSADRKFLFVFNRGGWDPTRVLAPEYDNANYDMEADGALSTAGGIEYVDHAARPSVRSFVEANHDRMLVMNGVLVPSVAHEVCTMLAMTGSASGFASDWAAIIGAAASDRFTLPHLVLGGPSFPGEYGTAVARSGQGGQLDGLLNGDALGWSDAAVKQPPAPAQGIVDRYLLRRAIAQSDGARTARAAELADATEVALRKAVDLKDLRYSIDFGAGSDLDGQAAVAVDAFQLGLSRCVTVGYPGDYAGTSWDTHANNDPDQSTLWEGLFQGLGRLMAMLDAAPGTVAPSLADETVVVVISEMGRTPQLNGVGGKDHWPFTSLMLVGSGLTTDRVVGATDSDCYGLPVDPATGETVEEGQALSAQAVGATLLVLADVDPAEHTEGVEPIVGILS